MAASPGLETLIDHAISTFRLLIVVFAGFAVSRCP
jgi:hypothetical protein